MLATCARRAGEGLKPGFADRPSEQAESSQPQLQLQGFLLETLSTNGQRFYYLMSFTIHRMLTGRDTGAPGMQMLGQHVCTPSSPS